MSLFSPMLSAFVFAEKQLTKEFGHWEGKVRPHEIIVQMHQRRRALYGLLDDPPGRAMQSGLHLGPFRICSSPVSLAPRTCSRSDDSLAVPADNWAKAALEKPQKRELDQTEFDQADDAADQRQPKRFRRCGA